MEKEALMSSTEALDNSIRRWQNSGDGNIRRESPLQDRGK